MFHLISGFGAILPNIPEVLHRFDLFETFNNPNYDGIQQIISNYRETVKTVESFSNPRHIAPTIWAIIDAANAPQNAGCYFVLFITIYAEIADNPEAKKAIGVAAGLPISIVIVYMGITISKDKLSTKRELLTEGCVRHNVELIALQNLAIENRHTLLGASLAREVLPKVEKQFVDYYGSQKISV